MKIIDWQNIELNEEMVQAAQSHIGKTRPIRPWNRQVTEDTIRHMANAVGDDNPLFWDEAYGKGTRWGEMIGAPYYPYSFNSAGDPNAADPLPGLLGLWAGDRWRWSQPARPGDIIDGVSFLAEANLVRSSFAGKAVELVNQSDFLNQRGEHIATYQSLIRRFSRTAGRSNQKYADIPPASYTPEEIQAIAEQYEAEAAQRRGAEPRHWEDVQVGDAVNTLLKGPLTVTTLATWLMGWGSPNCQANRMLFSALKAKPSDLLMNPATNIPDTIEGAHWDDFFAKQSGYPRGYDFGCMRCAWFIHQMSDWIGDDGFLRDLEARFILPNLLGDTLWLTGQVREKMEEDGKGLARCELTATNQRQEVVAVGFATAELPRRVS